MGVSPATPPVEPAWPLVALVDDDASLYHPIRQLVEEALEGRVFIAQHRFGNAALEAFREQRKPDVVLLDLALPDTDGVAVLKKMKTDPDLRSIPVVMLSGNSQWALVSRALEEGADTYLFKPPDPQLFVEVVRQLYSRARGPAAPR